jgi:sigma-B regulation protein RsbU (phosphoserine phosphatase)
MSLSRSNQNQQRESFTHSEHANSTERERNQHILDVVYNITIACHGITSFRDIFEVMNRELARVFSFDAAYFAVCDANNPKVFRAAFMYDEGEVEYIEGVEVGFLTNKLLETRQPLLFGDLVAEREQLGQTPQPFGTTQKRSRSWMGVPLLIGQGAVGVISIQSYVPYLYSDEDCDSLLRLGSVAAVALENAYLDQNQQMLSLALSDQVAMRTVELTTLSAITGELVVQQPLPILLHRALDWIIPLFQLDAASVRVYDAKNDDLVLRAQHGIRGVYEHQQVHMHPSDLVREQLMTKLEPMLLPMGTIADQVNGLELEHALLLLPIHIGGNFIGTFGLFGEQVSQFEEQQLDLVKAVSNQLAIAIENARLFEEQGRQIAELKALGAIGHIATTVRDEHTAIPQIFEALGLVMQLTAFSLTIYNPTLNIIVEGLMFEENEVHTYWPQQPPPPDSLTAWMLKHKKHLHFDNLREEIRNYPELTSNVAGATHSAVSWLGMPLLDRDGVTIGTISVQSTELAAFGEADVAFFDLVARQIALFVYNLTLHKQRERQIRELDAIGKIGASISASFTLDELLQVIYDTLQESTSISVFYMLICDAETRVLTHSVFIEEGENQQLPWLGEPPPPGTLSEWVLSSGEPLLFRDLQFERARLREMKIRPRPLGVENPVRSWMAVPILSQEGQTIGMLSLQHYEPYQYDQQTIEFISQIANHISLGVQKVRLFEERERQLLENALLFASAQDHAIVAERHAQRMAVVNRISLLLNSRLDLQEILSIAVREMVDLFWSDHIGIALVDEEGEYFVVQAEHHSRGAVGFKYPCANNPAYDEIRRTMRPLYIPSVKDDPLAVAIRDGFLQSQLESTLLIPLISRGNVIGTLGVDCTNRPWSLVEEEQDLFTTVAASIASAIENARLFAAERTAHRTAETLREVARVLSSSFERRVVLRMILHELRQVITYNTATIMLLDRSDTLRYAAYTGFEEGIDLQEYAVRIEQGSAAWQVVKQRETIIIPDTRQSPIWRPEPLELSIASWMGVPMIVRDQLLGVLNIDSSHANAFTKRDADAARAFADQAAVALENARLYEESVTNVEQELAIARRIQSNLFPRSLPQLPGLTLDARCLPARETGGDFYDFVMLNEHEQSAEADTLALIVGDASGKSITGAMLMAIARSIVRSEARNHILPEQVLRATNRWIAEDVPERSFVALSYATFDLLNRRLCLSNGGQLAPFLRRADGSLDYINVPGPALPLGAMRAVPYSSYDIDLQPGDLVLFYTDGIVEAQNTARELFGFERLEALVRTYGGYEPQELNQIILQAIADFMGTMPQHDDMTIVAMRIEA